MYTPERVALHALIESLYTPDTRVGKRRGTCRGATAEQRFRGGLVFKAHRWLFHSTLGSRVIKKKKKERHLFCALPLHSAAQRQPERTRAPAGDWRSCFRV